MPTPLSPISDRLSTPPDSVWVEDGQAFRPLQTSGSGTFHLHSLSVSIAPNPTAGQDVSIASPKQGVRRLRLRWQLPLHAITRVLGDEWERGYGNMAWLPRIAHRVLPWYTAFGHDTATVAVGVATGPAALCFWQVEASGITLTLDLGNGDSPVLLGDRQLHACTIISVASQPDQSPFQLVTALCAALCPNPRLPQATVYGGNDWYARYGHNSEASIIEDATRIAALAQGLDNRPFMVIDDGWQTSMCHSPNYNGGPWHQGNDRFPDLPTLPARLKALGVRPGIWCRPLHILPTDAANHTLLPHRLDGSHGLTLDPSHPDTLAKVKADIARFRHWGFEMVKHDFTSFDILGAWGFQFTPNITSGNWTFWDRTKTTAEIIRNLYAAIRQAAGDDMLLIGCNTIGHLAAGLVELQRTGDDTSGKHWERTRRMGVNTLAFRMPQHQTFFLHDADCVGLTTQVPWHLNATWLDLLARSGTPLFVSIEPAACGPDQQRALQAAFQLAASPQPIAEPLDWLTTTTPHHWRSGHTTHTYDFSADSGALPNLPL